MALPGGRLTQAGPGRREGGFATRLCAPSNALAGRDSRVQIGRRLPGRKEIESSIGVVGWKVVGWFREIDCSRVGFYYRLW